MMPRCTHALTLVLVFVITHNYAVTSTHGLVKSFLLSYTLSTIAANCSCDTLSCPHGVAQTKWVFVPQRDNYIQVLNQQNEVCGCGLRELMRMRTNDPSDPCAHVRAQIYSHVITKSYTHVYLEAPSIVPKSTSVITDDREFISPGRFGDNSFRFN